MEWALKRRQAPVGRTRWARDQPRPNAGAGRPVPIFNGPSSLQNVRYKDPFQFDHEENVRDATTPLPPADRRSAGNIADIGRDWVGCEFVMPQVQAPPPQLCGCFGSQSSGPAQHHPVHHQRQGRGPRRAIQLDRPYRLRSPCASAPIGPFACVARSLPAGPRLRRRTSLQRPRHVAADRNAHC